MSSTPAKTIGWFATTPHRRALEPDKAGDDVAREITLDLVEIALVCDLRDQFFHVVGRVGICRDERIEAPFHTLRIVIEWADRSRVPVREGQEVDESPNLREGFDVVLESAVRDG